VGVGREGVYTWSGCFCLLVNTCVTCGRYIKWTIQRSYDQAIVGAYLSSIAPRIFLVTRTALCTNPHLNHRTSRPTFDKQFHGLLHVKGIGRTIVSTEDNWEKERRAPPCGDWMVLGASCKTLDQSCSLHISFSFPPSYPMEVSAKVVNAVDVSSAMCGN